MRVLAADLQSVGPTMLAREAIPADLPELASLNREFNRVERSVEDMRRVLDLGEAEIVVVAEHDHRITGFACVQVRHSICYAEPDAELTELFVRESERRLGAATALVRASEGVARHRGARTLVLRTNLTNEAAKQFFFHLGYEQVSHIVLRRKIRAASAFELQLTKAP